MNGVFSLQGYETTVNVSAELRRLINQAYELHGQGVDIPVTAVGNACADLSSKTTEEILEIRRQERSISSQTLALRFA